MARCVDKLICTGNAWQGNDAITCYRLSQTASPPSLCSPIINDWFLLFLWKLLQFYPLEIFEKFLFEAASVFYVWSALESRRRSKSVVLTKSNMQQDRDRGGYTGPEKKRRGNGRERNRIKREGKTTISFRNVNEPAATSNENLSNLLSFFFLFLPYHLFFSPSLFLLLFLFALGRFEFFLATTHNGCPGHDPRPCYL